MSGAPTGFRCPGQEVSFSEGKNPDFQALFSFVFSFFLPLRGCPGPRGQGGPPTSWIAQSLPRLRTQILGLSAPDSLGKTKIWGLLFGFVGLRVPVLRGLVACAPDCGPCEAPHLLRPRSVDRGIRKDREEQLVFLRSWECSGLAWLCSQVARGSPTGPSFPSTQITCLCVLPTANTSLLRALPAGKLNTSV